MRAQDKRVLSEAARDLHLWPLVRRTKAVSDQYIGRPGFGPKPIDCKAKTADQGPLQGLVVSVELKPDAFSPRRIGAARDDWQQFADYMKRQPDSGYDVVRDRTLAPLERR